VDAHSTLRVLSGQKATSQLEATYFMSSYAFLFPYSIGAPDLKFQPRDRRGQDEPVVDYASVWSKAMMQRIEGQFRRDLTLPFALWSLVLRTVVNIGHNMSAIIRHSAPHNGITLDGEDFRNAALAIMEALKGKYQTAQGERPVNGDLQVNALDTQKWFKPTRSLKACSTAYKRHSRRSRAPKKYVH
jgi:hypothetical protein